MGEQGEAETNQDGVVADPGAELQDSGDKPMLDGVVFSLKVQVHNLGVLPESGTDRTSMARGPFISLFEQQQWASFWKWRPGIGDPDAGNRKGYCSLCTQGSPWRVWKLQLLKMWLQRCCHITTGLKHLHCFPITF